MKKIIPYFCILIVLILLNVVPVYAHCPLCTAAVATGVITTRYYGVNDSIVGIWIGAFIISTALWFNRILKKKYVPLQPFLLSILALVLTVVPLYFARIITNSSKILGIDRLLFGILIGSFISYVGVFVSKGIKNKRKKVLFPFQTIVIILVSLIITSLILWLAVK